MFDLKKKFSSLQLAKLHELLSDRSVVKVLANKKADSNALAKLINPEFKTAKQARHIGLAHYSGKDRAVKGKQLAEYCLEFFGLPVCTAKKSSNWNCRPLKLAQLHYTCLYAQLLLLVWRVTTGVSDYAGHISSHVGSSDEFGEELVPKCSACKRSCPYCVT